MNSVNSGDSNITVSVMRVISAAQIGLGIKREDDKTENFLTPVFNAFIAVQGLNIRLNTALEIKLVVFASMTAPFVHDF